MGRPVTRAPFSSLADPFVRPTIQTPKYIEASSYNLVKSATPDVVYPSLDGPIVQTSAGANVECWILFPDRIPSIMPDVIYLLKVRSPISMTGDSQGGPDFVPFFANLSVAGIPNGWDPATLTWNTRPTTGSTGLGQLGFISTTDVGSTLSLTMTDGSDSSCALVGTGTGEYAGLRIQSTAQLPPDFTMSVSFAGVEQARAYVVG